MKYRATGGSMIPFIPPGSILWVERVTASHINKGDVVGYIGENTEGVAHRVVGKRVSDSGIVFCTRGDAQQTPDEVEESSVLFVVRRVRYRLIAYNTGSAIGRCIARIALAETKKTQATKAACRHSFKLASATWKSVRFALGLF